MRRIDIEYITQYNYPSPVQFLPHKLYMRPREGHDIRIESSALNITPSYNIEWQRDVATLFIEACRYCGLASRFVSGYLVSNTAVEDYATTHAW